MLAEDFGLMRIPDSQSLGGSNDTNAPKWGVLKRALPTIIYC